MTARCCGGDGPGVDGKGVELEEATSADGAVGATVLAALTLLGTGSDETAFTALTVATDTSTRSRIPVQTRGFADSLLCRIPCEDAVTAVENFAKPNGAPAVDGLAITSIGTGDDAVAAAMALAGVAELCPFASEATSLVWPPAALLGSAAFAGATGA